MKVKLYIKLLISISSCSVLISLSISIVIIRISVWIVNYSWGRCSIWSICFLRNLSVSLRGSICCFSVSSCLWLIISSFFVSGDLWLSIGGCITGSSNTISSVNLSIFTITITSSLNNSLGCFCSSLIHLF